MLVTQIQDQYALLQGKIVTDVISLYKAMGGGWQVRQGRTILPESVLNQMSQRTDWGDLLDTQPSDRK